jgi:hypothetical protein
MLTCVAIRYVEVSLAGKQISQEEGVFSLVPSSANIWAKKCMRVSVDAV